MRFRAGPAILCLALGLVSTNVHAFVLSEDPLEGDSLSLGGTVRMYNLMLRGGPLETTGAFSPPNPASVSILAMRPALELKKSWGLDLVIHDELTSTSSSLPATLSAGALSLGQGAQAPVWLPLQWSLVDDPVYNYQVRDRIDWMYARYTTGDVTFTLGRQPISIGRGQIWTPEDLIAPFSPLQIDTEFKPGADAARVDWNPSESVTLMLAGAAAKDDNSAVIGRAEVALDPLRVGVMAGSVRTDAVVGMDFFADLGGGTDLHGEATTTWVTQRARRPSGRRGFERAVIGTTSEPAKKLHVTAEAYWNGAGASKQDDYLAEAASPRVAIGETYTLGRVYGGVGADWEAHPLLHVELSAIANLHDPSAIIAPTLRYSVAQNASLIAGAYVPIGATRTEFGLYPEIYHVDAKLWF